ncbi:MAG TPA: DUF4430 domain-containing protein [Candidatus Thermoplasmatota archaeon]|nr:DUF4430 domain-containing protein [Candidatus Thermoplasmatota archaeon]
MNMKNQSNLQQLILLIGLILFGTIGRYVLFGMGVQPFPNFEVIMVATFLGVLLLRPTVAFIVPLASMICSDILIGNPIFIGSQMNRIVLFTYSGFAIIALINIFNKGRLQKAFGTIRARTVGLAAGLGIGFVLLYDVWTNLGWWYLMYPHDAASLAVVFTAGLPFMVYHMISGVVTFVAIAIPVLLIVQRKTTQVQPIKVTSVHKIPVALVVLGLVALSFTGTAMQVPTKSEIWLGKTQQTSVTLVITANGWTLHDQLVAYPGETVFSLLKRSSSNQGYSLKYTYYPTYAATLVDSINNLASGTDGKYWQYYVNGVCPMVGADKYLVSNGDSVTWSFETVSS